MAAPSSMQIVFHASLSDDMKTMMEMRSKGLEMLVLI